MVDKASDSNIFDSENHNFLSFLEACNDALLTQSNQAALDYCWITRN